MRTNNYDPNPSAACDDERESHTFIVLYFRMDILAHIDTRSSQTRIYKRSSTRQVRNPHRNADTFTIHTYIQIQTYNA